MTHTTNTRPTLADLIADLIDPTTTGETIDRLEHDGHRWRRTHRRHLVHHPSLLDQLRATTSTSTISLGESFRPVFASKPSARLDALRALQRIEVESLHWARMVGGRTRTTLEDRLRSLVPHDTAQVDAAGRKRTLHAAAQAWLTLARVVTGWENAPFAPNVPCPNVDCERRQSVRVRFDEVRPSGAACVECGTTWDADALPSLAAYVQWAAEHLGGAQHLVLDDVTQQLVVCGECSEVREQMAYRRVMRARSARGDTPDRVAG